MVHRFGQIAERGLEHFARLERAGAERGLAGMRVPHLPRRSVEDRFGEDVAHFEIAGMRLVREAHGVGIGVVPGTLVVDGVALGIAGGQRLDQRTFRRGDAAC